MKYKYLESCLICRNPKLQTYFDMGGMPLVNNLKLSLDEETELYPLRVNRCPSCSHIQLSIAVNPKILFDNYFYRTGVSKAHKEFFKSFCSLLKDKGSVLDIGSNDGSLLEEFKSLGWDCLGIEPCKELVEETMRKGIEVVKGYFPALINRKFDCITAFNVFAHNDKPLVFLSSMRDLLKDTGSIFILTTPARLDNYYHEHISYFNLKSMMILARKCGLFISSYQEVNMHGGSLLFELKPIQVRNDKFFDFILDNKPVVGYGASAHGIVLLNNFNIKPEYVIDDNPSKVGKYIPGVDVPIYSSDKLKSDNRDLNIIVLAYHLSNEIIPKIRSMRFGKKDTFIHPKRGII